MQAGRTPGDETTTFETLLAIAMAAERNAARTYVSLAQTMAAHGRDDIARVFERLADEETRHDREVSDIAVRYDVTAADAATALPMWPRGEAPRLDHDVATNPATSTPYRALAYAVDNEELAFRYYSYAATMAADARTQALAEALAREELGHAALLRSLRREAFHAEGGAEARDSLRLARAISSVDELLRAALTIEEGLVSCLRAAGDGDPVVAALVEDLAAGVASLRDEIPTDSRVPPTSAHAEDRSAVPAEPAAIDAFERAFAFYDAVVHHSRDEATGERAQALAADTLARLLVLRRHAGMAGGARLSA
ncbi:MAG: ferritin family protein [Gammaproteobacteria bacterium]